VGIPRRLIDNALGGWLTELDKNDDPEAHGWIASVVAHHRARLRSGIVV
jgi:hypothetical protein